MYDYYHGPRIRLDRLLSILAELPTDCWIWPNSTGSLSVHTGNGQNGDFGTWLGVVDCGYHEQMMWADGRVVEQDDGDGTPG